MTVFLLPASAVPRPQSASDYLAFAGLSAAYYNAGQPRIRMAAEGLNSSAAYELALCDATIAMYSVYVTGQASLQLRDSQSAAAAFRKVLEHPGIVGISPLGPLARLGLAQALGLAGDTSGSRAAYQTFLETWKDADPDLPVLIQARKRYAAISR